MPVKMAKAASKAPVMQNSAAKIPAPKKSSTGKSTLLKELESVFQTAPKEYDVDESADFHTKAMFEGDNDDSDGFIPVASRNAMAFLDDDPEYQGKKTSSKVAFDMSSDESQGDADRDGSSISVSSSDDDSQSDDENGEDLVYDPESSGDKKKARSAADSSRVLDMVRQVRAEEEIKVTKVDTKEFERSAAASAQRDFLDCLLEFRIRLQKPLSIANRLPRQQMVGSFATLCPEYLTKRDAAIEACGCTLHSLLLLRSNLSSQFPGCPAVAPVPADEFKIGSKRSAHVSFDTAAFHRCSACLFRPSTNKPAGFSRFRRKVCFGER
jgi:hypothetical protein